MNFIPQSAEISLDDVVVTSGLEQYIPRGLIIGKIIEVTKDNNELWQNAVIESTVDSEDLVIVSVLLPQN
jgi:rod shape-determining protein MreC